MNKITETLESYQGWRKSQSHYPAQGTPRGIEYAVIALVGEAGEVANEWKKVIRDDEGKLTPWRKEKLLLELGDVLWYLDAAAEELGSSIQEVMGMNMDKINARRKAG